MILSGIARRLFGITRAPPVPLVAEAPLRVPHKPVTDAEAFLRCLALMPHLAPREASVGAFVAWLQELGETGEHYQADLLANYEGILDLVHSRVGVEQMPAKWFGRALETHGCRRWKAEEECDGHRWRPMKVWVPHTAASRGTGGATFPHGHNRHPSGPNRGRNSRTGSRNNGKRDHLTVVAKGARHRADIVEAVAYEKQCAQA